MTHRTWTYPPELMDALAGLGLRPHTGTPPLVVRDALNDLYRYELRRMRNELRAGRIAKPDYIDLVIAKRKQFWPLTLQPDAWERICRPEGPTGEESAPHAHRPDSATLRRRRGR
jgi:hypothetical protein